jgi:hypothetical protein
MPISRSAPRQVPGDVRRRPGAGGWTRVFPAWWCWRRRTLSLQLLGTVIVLGWVAGNGFKLAVMVVIWVIGFGRLSLAELATAGLVNVLFVGMDEGALRQGIFQFRHPDAVGLPVYEFFMWGFYILHAVRFLDGSQVNPRRILRPLGLAVVFALCYSVITDPVVLAAAAGTVLAASLVIFHEPMDLAFTVYMAAVGALVEYVGVGTGQWSYPHAPAGGVPLWSFAMWGGIGLFSRRLLAPFLQQDAVPRLG